MTDRPRRPFPLARHGTVAAVACVVASFAPSSEAQVPGQREPVRAFPPLTIPRMREQGTVSGAPERRSMLSVGRDASIGIVPPDAVPPDPREVVAMVVDGAAVMQRTAPGLLVLQDGQRLPGSIEERNGQVAWRSPWCAPRPMDLDGIRGLVIGDGEPPEAADADVVILRNGDRQQGVVTSIGARTLSLEQDSPAGRGTVTIPLDAVVSVGLAGPVQPRSGVRAWVADGSVIDGPRAAWLGSDYLQLPGVPGARTESITIPRPAVMAVQMDPAAAIPLCGLVPEVTVPPGMEGLRYDTPAPSSRAGSWALGAAPVDVEGPVLLSYAAPPFPARLVATAHRAGTVRAAGDVDLVVRAAGRELARERLDPSRARTELRIDLPAEPFELMLVPVGTSAAGCFVSLDRAVLYRR